MGFGEITGIDIGGEVRGVLPPPQWKRNAYRRPEQQKWYAGETISLGIGQGYNNFTMLQLAQATATVADNGMKHEAAPGARQWCDTVTRRGHSRCEQPPARTSAPSPRTSRWSAGRWSAVEHRGHRRAACSRAPPTSGGKTGTAQAVTQAQNTKYNARALEEQQRDHALFMAFAPANDPKIAVAMIVENAGLGRRLPRPIARRVFDYWLMDQYPSEADMAAIQIGKATAPIGKPRVASEVAWPD